MKSTKIVYGITTGVFSLWMLTNAYAYIFTDEAKRLCIHFGFPDYFRIELGIAKFIGVLILLLPILRSWLKQWAYAGFTITMISGIIAHLSSGDPIASAGSPVIALHLLLASYYCYQKLHTVKISLTSSLHFKDHK